MKMSVIFFQKLLANNNFEHAFTDPISYEMADEILQYFES